MSFVTRLWNSIRNPMRYVGRDLHGNKFYEAYSPNDPSRAKRTVKYQESEDMWKYIGGNRRLAVQWSAWLTHTRRDPPTVQELQADILRQQRVSENVALIEARDRAEREEMLRIRQHDAALALTEAAARNDAVALIPEPQSSSSPANMEHTATDTQQQRTEPPPRETASPTPLSAHPMVKVLPPKFVTPAAPRKTRTLAKFSLPSSVNQFDVEEKSENRKTPPKQSREAQSETLRKEEATHSQAPPPMPSRPISETESWTPKARRRG